MYQGLKLYNLKYVNMSFDAIDPSTFRYGEEMPRLVHEAALCIGVMDGFTLEGVFLGRNTIGKCKLYLVKFMIDRVRVEFAFTIENIATSDAYDWLFNDSISRHEKVSYLRNFMSTVLIDFNKGLKPMIFK